ncbi:MAG: hypothetical protein J5902_02375 [Paludibacteraceae bacterium]|nr:hypothetical protein [Paludibacteraceae bacterium]MBQ9296000.1 hypothetical protein [Paludibacteraceae bacterium]
MKKYIQPNVETIAWRSDELMLGGMGVSSCPGSGKADAPARRGIPQ